MGKIAEEKTSVFPVPGETSTRSGELKRLNSLKYTYRCVCFLLFWSQIAQFLRCVLAQQSFCAVHCQVFERDLKTMRDAAMPRVVVPQFSIKQMAGRLSEETRAVYALTELRRNPLERPVRYGRAFGPKERDKT